jgi:ribosomal protein L37E
VWGFWFAVKPMTMNLLEFVRTYPDEASCREDFRTVREKAGICCRKCGGERHYWLKAKWQWQCAACGFRTTLRSGSMMEDARLPVRTWYLAMALMTFSKKGISACEMQRQLGHSRYHSIWFLMHRLRKAMGERDDLYTLKGEVEFDEAFFEQAIQKRVALKRGKGSQRQVNVAVMAESTPLEDIDTGKRQWQCRYFKMKVLGAQDSAAIEQCVKENLDPAAVAFTDKSITYANLGDHVEAHITELSQDATANGSLRWVHIAISNAKRNLLGVYHKVKGAYLQSYLDEFCYKLNRRYFGKRLFDRLIIAVAASYWHVSG